MAVVEQTGMQEFDSWWIDWGVGGREYRYRQESKGGDATVSSVKTPPEADCVRNGGRNEAKP